MVGLNTKLMFSQQYIYIYTHTHNEGSILNPFSQYPRLAKMSSIYIEYLPFASLPRGDQSKK